MPSEQELFDQFGSIFRDLFANAATKTRGADLARTLQLSLVEAIEGCERESKIERPVACTSCEGMGGVPGASWRPCVPCKATGHVARAHGTMTISTVCASCAGRGGTWSAKCAACGGEGRATRYETLNVHVPAGVTEGHRLRLEGKGEDVGEGKPVGDLFLEIAVTPDPRFRREGDDLHTRVKITKAQATSGGAIDVPLPKGTRRAEVKPGSKSGDELVLRACGAVKLGSPAVPISITDEPYRSVDASEHRGDVIVTLDVEGDPMPAHKLTREELEARERARSDRHLAWIGYGVIFCLLCAIGYALVMR